MTEAARHHLLAWCRPHFEAECAQELIELDAASGGGGYPRTERGCGHVEFITRDSEAAARLLDRAGPRGPIFARQLLQGIGRISSLPREDRISALLPQIDADPRRWCELWIESSDAADGRALNALCRGLESAMVAVLKRSGRMDRASPWRLHVALLDATQAWMGASHVERSSPWPRGIPRLRFARAAPSRSTLKLEEAFLTLLDAHERDAWLQPGMRAVDLGAAPGGWTWQLVRRSIHVSAIDNGPMDAALMESGLVEHLREDGFRHLPRKPVDWLVCDMVEQPRRVSACMARWLRERQCDRALFNLKLPMKKRYDEVRGCLDLLREQAGCALDLRARQLYHDREEITVFARRA